MSKDIDELLKKLIGEKFGGKEPKWKEANWCDTRVLCAEDTSNWYYRNGDVIYAQAKEGDHTPHCYGCSSEIQFTAQKNSVWDGRFDGAVGGGEVRQKFIPYCPSCEKTPKETSVIIE